MTYFVNVTSQGQISIPAALRRKLGFDKTNKAVVVERSGRLEIKPVTDILSLRGIFSTKKTIPFDKVRKGFEEALAAGEA